MNLTPEVVMNLWIFIQTRGSTHVIHELGARPYMMSGSDVEMSRLLKALAISDFHFARRFPVPDRYSVKLVDPIDGSEATRKGLCALDPSTSRVAQMEYFKEALDEVEQSLPTRRIGIDGVAQTRPDINRKNLLCVITKVAVFDDGRQLALVDHPLRNEPAAATTNLWAFGDAKTSCIYRVSGRAYMLHGADRDRERVMTALAQFDFSMAEMLSPPPRSRETGDGAKSVNRHPYSTDGKYGKYLFDEVFQLIDGSISKSIGIDRKVKNRVVVAARESRSLANLIVERAHDAKIGISPILVAEESSPRLAEVAPIETRVEIRVETREPVTNSPETASPEPLQSTIIVEAKPRDAGAWIKKGTTLANFDRYEEAIVCFDRALAIDLRVAEVWRRKADVLNRMNRFEDAIDCYDNALAIDPRSPSAWSNKSGVLNRLGRHDAAIACCNSALALDPGNLDAWINKGDALNRLDRLTEAVLCYDRALDIDSDAIRAWANKGDALNGLNRYEDAIKCCDRALEIDERFAWSWNNKGLAFERLRRFEDALACYGQAMNLEPGESWPRSASKRVSREMIHRLY